VHDPSIAVAYRTSAGNENTIQYYLFTTDMGTPEPPFLVQRCSPDGFTWEVCGSVFTDSLPWWVYADAPGVESLWAPDISYINGEWRLYYAGSSFGSQNSVIGLATAVTLDPSDPAYGWTDRGAVLRSNNSVDFNAIDPSVFVDQTGTSWLAFGSFWSGIKSVQLNASGLVVPSPQFFSLAQRASPDALEAATLGYANGYYYLFSSWNYCCRGNLSTYEVRVGRSKEVTGPFLDETGMPLMQGGGTFVVGKANGWAAGGGQSLLRTTPALAALASTSLVLHAYDGLTGDPWVQFLPLNWTSGWPVTL
jgi:arabinan endo-1,5-alpha-L-arabinosidase